MRWMKTIRFKPKPECINEFLKEYHFVTEKALKKGSIDSYFTAIIQEEVVYVGIFNKKETSENILGKGLDWLEKYKHMLLPYPDGDELALVEDGSIVDEVGN